MIRRHVMDTFRLAVALVALQFPETSAVPGTVRPEATPLLRADLPSARADALPREGSAARPNTYVDAIGQRAYVESTEDGPIYEWVWPLQVFVDGRFTFQPEKSADAFDVMRRAQSVDVEPSPTLVRYAAADLDLRAEFIALDGERAILVLLRADLDGRGTLRFRFVPKLQPQWPAAAGGVAGAWRPELGGYAISEPSARLAPIVACPPAPGGTAGLQYLLPDGPLEIGIPLESKRCASEIVPLVVVAADGENAPAHALATYARVLRTIPALVREREAAWRKRLEDVPSISVPGGVRAAPAFRDAAVAPGQSVGESDTPGDGSVARYRPAGAGPPRPGLARYFTGDGGGSAPAY